MLVYNEERHLDAAIESVLGQSFTNFQLIISDNYSTDSSSKIIEKYLKQDSRVIKVSPQNHCSSNEHFIFVWDEILPKFQNKYSIHIGGHDLWGQDYLKLLINKAEASQNVAIVYGDGYDLDYATDQILGKYEDQLTLSNTIKPFIPAVMLLSLTVNIIIFGLMLESKRREVKMRHSCTGYDHLYVAEIALLGKVLHEPNAHFFLRRSKDHGSLAAYAKRHLRLDTVADTKPYRDFYLQLDWALHLIELAVSDLDYVFFQQSPIKNMLKTSLINGYIVRYMPNLNMLGENTMLNFLKSNHMLSIYDVNSASVNFIEQLISDNLAQ
jgi:glycosyltransferase involved in cell wall biosynthesis